MQTNVPDTMRAIVLEQYHPVVTDAIASLKVMERPVPRPGRNQVLVRVEAAPCHPSDLLFLQGKYGELKTLPAIPGREGAGQVVVRGPGLMARLLRNTRVACAVQGDRDGTWAQYFVADVMNCIPLKRKLRMQQAATMIANPLTAIALLETARRDGHRGAVHTAAASQLGRMLIPLAKKWKFPIVNVVRERQHMALMRSCGAEHVLDSSDANFDQQLRSLARELEITAVFEAIAGASTGVVLGCLPDFAHVYLFGALSEESCSQIGPINLIFGQKSISGFYLPHWVQKRGTLHVLRSALAVQNMLINSEIETVVHRRLTLDETAVGLQQYVDEMTTGKMLIMPHKK